MRAISQWLLSRRYRAVFGIVVAGLLMQGTSGALVALVTLEKGMREGFYVSLLAILPLAALFIPLGVQVGDFSLAFGFAWVPMLALAALLIRGGSLKLCVQVAVLVSTVAVALVVMKMGDPVAVWRGVFDEQVIPWMESRGMPVRTTEEGLNSLALQMTGFAAAMLLLVTLGHFFLGRWMQSLTAQPGGFGLEYRELRMGLVIGVLAGVVFTLNALVAVPVIQNVVWIFIFAFYLQGLAVAHGLVAGFGAHRAWLVGLYVAQLVTFPLACVMLAGLGFVDNWTDLRARLQRRGQ